MTFRDWLAWLAVATLASALVTACAVPRAVPLPACGREPAEVLACARQREDAVTSLRAVFTAETRGTEQRSATGILLVAKPDAFRLRLMMPLGLTVLDYVKNGDLVRVALPLEGRFIKGGKVHGPVPFSEADLSQAFLRGAFAFPGTCQPQSDGAHTVVVHCRDGAGTLLRELRLDTESASIREETSYAGAQPRFLLRYDDYRPAGDGVLPYRIALGYPARNITLEITIERYEVNAALARDLFQPAAP